MYELTVDDLLDRLEAAGCRPRRSGHGWRAHCPLHDDRDPSLMVDEGPLVFCHGGCGRQRGFFGRLLAELSKVDSRRAGPARPVHPSAAARSPGAGSLSAAGASPAPGAEASPSGPLGAGPASATGLFRAAREARLRRERAGVRDTYEPISGAWVYTGRTGRPLARKVRQIRVDAFTGQRRREFRWQKPVSCRDGSGRVTWMASRGDIEPATLPLFDPAHLDAAWARGVRVVAVTEGERDCVTLRRLGAVATCAPNGSGPWQAQWTAALADWPRIVIVVDNDPAGWRRGNDIFAALAGGDGARVVRVLAPPPPYGDVTELIRAGGVLADLIPRRSCSCQGPNLGN